MEKVSKGLAAVLMCFVMLFGVVAIGGTGFAKVNAKASETTTTTRIYGTGVYSLTSSKYESEPLDIDFDNVSINIAPETKVGYKSDVTLTVTATGLPKYCYLVLRINGDNVAEGTNTEVTYHVGQVKESFSYSVAVFDKDDAPRNTARDCHKDYEGKYLEEESTVKCNSGIFAILIAFFREIFGTLPVVKIGA